jgi:hypothetical protein
LNPPLEQSLRLIRHLLTPYQKVFHTVSTREHNHKYKEFESKKAMILLHSLFESFRDSSCENPFVSLPKDLQNFNSNSKSNPFLLSNQICVSRRTSPLSFMPLCSETESEEKYFDVALDSFVHEQASKMQPSGPSISVPAPALVQSPFDPSNPLYSVEFANFAKDCLKELARQMETSEKSRSKVAMIKMLLMRHEKKGRFTRKLAATGLNTTKSEELRAHYLNFNNKASGTRSPINVTSSSSYNAKPISYAAIKDARREYSTTRYEVPAVRKVSMDETVNFDDVVSSSLCPSGMNMNLNLNLNTQHMINSNPHFTARRVPRRRSSLAIQSFQMQFFPDSM